MRDSLPIICSGQSRGTNGPNSPTGLYPKGTTVPFVRVGGRGPVPDAPSLCSESAKSICKGAHRACCRTLPQARVEPLERRRTGAKLLLSQRIERRVDGRKMVMQVVGIAVDVEEPGDDLALRRVMQQEAHRGELVVNIVFGIELAQRDLRTVVLLDDLHRPRLIIDLDRFAPGDEVEPVHRLVV